MKHVAGVSTIPPTMYANGTEIHLQVYNSHFTPQRFGLFYYSRLTMTGFYRTYKGLGLTLNHKHLRECHGACRRGRRHTLTPETLFFCFFFFTLVTGPRRSLSLKLSVERVYEPQI